jgi:HEAT repeat protein
MEKPLNAFSMMIGGGTDIYTVDWEKNPIVKKIKREFPSLSKIKSFPTFVFLNGGKLKAVVKGAMDISKLLSETKTHLNIELSKKQMFASLLHDLSSNNEDIIVSALNKIGFLISNQKEFDLFINHYSSLSNHKSPGVISALRNGLMNSLDCPELDTSTAASSLVEVLKDKNRNFRYKAAYELGKLEDRRALPVLLEMAKEKVGKIRLKAVWALQLVAKRSNKEISDTIASALIKLLGDPKKYIRLEASNALWGMGKNAIPHVVEALKNNDPLVRLGAAKALENRADERAISTLIQELSSEDHKIRSEAASILVNFRSKLVRSSLIDVLGQKDSSVRCQAAWALGERKDKESVPALIILLNDNSWEVRENAIQALGKIGNKKTVNYVIKALYDKHRWVQFRAAEALGDVGGAEVFPLLVKLLDHKNDLVRLGASRSLVKNKHPRSIPLLIKMLSDPDWSNRRETADVLGELGDKRALVILRKLKKNDPNQYVRESAAKAIKKILDI